MLSLNDALWQTLEGGFRAPYDASTALRRLEQEPSNAEVWDVLFQELHHQGDIGVASYAAVPHLVRICVTNNYVHWHTFGLVGIIESERHQTRNPTLPDWLETDYHEAIRELFRFGFAHVANLDNEGRIAFLSITAFALDLPLHGQMLLSCSDDEILKSWTPSNFEYSNFFSLRARRVLRGKIKPCSTTT